MAPKLMASAFALRYSTHALVASYGETIVIVEGLRGVPTGI